MDCSEARLLEQSKLNLAEFITVSFDVADDFGIADFFCEGERGGESAVQVFGGVRVGGDCNRNAVFVQKTQKILARIRF